MLKQTLTAIFMIALSGCQLQTPIDRQADAALLAQLPAAEPAFPPPFLAAPNTQLLNNLQLNYQDASLEQYLTTDRRIIWQANAGLAESGSATHLRAVQRVPKSVRERLYVIRLRELLYNSERFQWNYSLLDDDTDETLLMGNCLDFSEFVVAHARALGLDAEFVLVDSDVIWQQAQPNEWLALRHVAARVKADGQWFNFDVVNPESQHLDVTPITDQQAHGLFLANESVQKREEGRTSEADRLARWSVMKFPDHAGLWSNLAILHAQRNDANSDLDTARLFERAIAAGVSTDIALSNYQRYLLQRGDVTRAERMAYRLESYRAQHPAYLKIEAAQALTEGRPRRASSLLQTAIELSPDSADLYYALAAVEGHLGNETNASALMQSGRDLDQGRSSAIFYRKRAALAALDPRN